MSTATHAAPGKLSFGGLAVRILLILVLWAGLVAGLLCYVGYTLPRDYQISQARTEAATEQAKELANPEPVPATPAASAAPAAGAKAAPAANASATPAKAAASASAAPAPAPAPAGGAKKLPHDPLLAGYNRTALTNVARFYAIVVSVLCIGVILLQIFKYKHVEEEEPAH